MGFLDSIPSWQLLTPTARCLPYGKRRCICMITYYKQLLLRLRLFVLLLLHYKKPSMQQLVPTFHFFFFLGLVGNEFLASFQYPAYLRYCTCHLCGTELTTRRGVFPGMLRTCLMRTCCKIQKLFQSFLQECMHT